MNRRRPYRRRCRRCRRRSGRVDAVDASEKRERHLVRASALHGRIQQLARRIHLAALEGGHAAVQQLFGFALLLGERAPCALDIRTRPRMSAIERATALHKSGRLHDALRALEGVRPVDPLRADADKLKADIQRELIAHDTTAVPSTEVTK